MSRLRSLVRGALGALVVLCLPVVAAGQERPGDAHSELELLEEWELPEVRRAAGGKEIISAPFRCSAAEAAGHYADNARLPEKATRLYGQPRDSILQWLEDKTQIVPTVIETEHAIIVCALRPARARGLRSEEKDRVSETAGKVRSKLTTVQRAHLYAWRYLEAEAQVLDLLRLLEGSPRYDGPMPRDHLGCGERFEFYLISGEEPYQAFGRHFFGAFGEKASWWYQPDQDQLIAATHDNEVRDEVLAARFDGLVAFLFAQGYRGRATLLPDWVACGLGHWFERRHRRFEDTFVLNGTPESAHKKAWSWDERDFWTAAKRLVAKSEDTTLVDLARKQGVALSPRERMQAWSLVNYMISRPDGSLRAFMDGMKRREEFEGDLEAQVRAIRQVFGQDVVSFQEAWSEWVRRTRPPRSR